MVRNSREDFEKIRWKFKKEKFNYKKQKNFE